MKKTILRHILCVASFSLFATVYGQTPPDNDVVKVSTNLVQVDSVVTDKNGQPVTDLSIDDFELWQDGKRQTITNFTYVDRSSANRESSVGKTTKGQPSSPPPARSAPFGRVIAFVVDDGNCDSTMIGMRAAREGLEKFVTEQMQPDDVAAIYQTRKGSGLLQQYTSDKTRLLSVIRKIRWSVPDGICPSITGENYEPARNNSTLKPKGIQTFESEMDKERREAGNSFTRDRQTVGATGVLRYVINGLQQVGGRKLLFYLSDSLPVSNGKNNFSNAYYVVRDLATLANRASVVVNTIDVRGVDVNMPNAVDDPKVGRNDFLTMEKLSADRQMNDTARQSGLSYIAEETGGKFYRNANRIDGPIGEALKGERGYYLIGYQPEEEVFNGKKFHKIEIKLKRPDLVSTSRSGFYGVTDSDLKPKPRTGDRELYDALTAPLPNADIGLKLSAYFINSGGGNFIRSLLYIDGKDITFRDEANGDKKAVFDVIAVTLNEKNEVVDEFNRVHSVSVPANRAEDVRRNGLVYTADVPVKNEGVYIFRMALRETVAKRIGSASQVIEVPDLKKGRFIISGLILGSVDKNGKIAVPTGAKAENAFSPVILTSVPAVRRFHRGEILSYNYTLYNSPLDKSTSQPNFSVQTKLYQDGSLIAETPLQPAQLEKQADRSRINDFGYIKLNRDAQPGDYALQIVVQDVQTKQTVSQWIDFEIVE